MYWSSLSTWQYNRVTETMDERSICGRVSSLAAIHCSMSECEWRRNYRFRTTPITPMSLYSPSPAHPLETRRPIFLHRSGSMRCVAILQHLSMIPYHQKHRGFSHRSCQANRSGTFCRGCLERVPCSSSFSRHSAHTASRGGREPGSGISRTMRLRGHRGHEQHV
ncbi:hypothetical protein L226DRAFT_309911 [Lentinus tigrinus ALCF2SS1-7]|uniref:Uncharacterized protein n=1 Tax=Lentinus tigrinus ALCF2SS1-6 TaxID=1328759 RepID=A0A5C2S535_9APHY|nr:hypothetical protein L227DRAFT_176604 [Lentinus tigrinus ALCF2SS1-6]RPD68905.1 hypothetical protein L226DRAFT_309911 [Lentinus tigrinus ALCF2SS1-7]